MNVNVPATATEVTTKPKKPVALDFRFRDSAEDPTAPVVIHNGISTVTALARLGLRGWKKIYRYKVPGKSNLQDHFHVICREGTGVVLIMESEAQSETVLTVRKITMYAAMNAELVKKLNVTLPVGNERVVEPRVYVDEPRPKKVLLIEANVTNTVEKFLDALEFHNQPGREAYGLFLTTWCGKRWNSIMFAPKSMIYNLAEGLQRTSRNPNFSIERTMDNQAEALERTFPDWFRQMVSTDEYHALRKRNLKNNHSSGKAKPASLNSLANKFNSAKK